MSIDKKLDYVNQDGFKNYIKNSKSVTVPKEFKSRKNATPTKLAYITKDEAKMLKKMKKGTPHKGPKGIPSYDDFDAATGTFRSGAAMSAAETGGKTERDRADMRAAGISPQEAQDLRSAAIAAGAGQRVNPKFFDSRDTVSPAELKAAKKAFPKAFSKTRGGGLLGFLSSGGILGNLIRSLGQKFGLGKKFNEPSSDDMSQFNELGLLTGRTNPIFDDGSNKDLLSIISSPKTVAPMSVNTGIKSVPNVNLLAQPVYNLDGSIRDDNTFGYLDLPDGYFDTNTNTTNTNKNTSGGIVPLLNSDDLGEELEQVVGKLNLSP